MSVANDMLAILRRGPRTYAYVFGAQTGRGSFLHDDVEVLDDVGGSVSKNVRVFRVPIAQLTTIARGNSITINSTTYTVRDVRITGGGEIREVYVA